MDGKKVSQTFLILYALYYVFLFDNWMLPVFRRIPERSQALLSLNIRFTQTIYHTIPLFLLILYVPLRHYISPKVYRWFRKGLWGVAVWCCVMGALEQLIGLKLCVGLAGTWETMTVISLFLLYGSYVLDSSSLSLADRVLVLGLMWFTIQGSFEIIFQLLQGHYLNVFNKQVRVILPVVVYYLLARKYPYRQVKTIWMGLVGSLLCWILWVGTGFLHHNFHPYASTPLDELTIMFGWKVNKVLIGWTHIQFLRGFKAT